MDDQSILEAADSLKTKINGQKLDLSDLSGRMLMTSGSTYVYAEGSSNTFSLVILVVLCVTLLVMILLVITIVYLARKMVYIRRTIAKNRNQAYRKMDFGRDSSQSLGKYSYDSGVWLGPGPEPTFTVPDAPYYRPPTVDQIASTPRPVTAVRTRLKRNWNVDADRALSTIPDDFSRPFIHGERISLH
ncbi:low affinity immunoglobulin gamma Fc region receptor II-like [Uloborus diversus]|uniref:low affinity immunoglobulin gamma Fc region receptor II-like n=1 Tax=Uloborus diversus TaxID=327109 RepID=UPI00240984FA|nr:low affinity immunoglobulin gamma Fc region receptor II-like [Uloborus diversus]